MADESVRRARVIGGLRAAVGVVMIAAPQTMDRPAGHPSARGRFILLMRTIGIRDLALGLGTLAATRSGGDDVRRWLRMGLLSDAIDVVTGTASVKHVGKSGAAIAGGLPIPFVFADLWALKGASPSFRDQSRA